MENKEIFDRLAEIPLSLGAFRATVIPVSDVETDASFRDICATNACGNYGRNWMCPPDAGDIHDLMAELRTYTYMLVYQTVTELEDSYDFEGMMEAGVALNQLMHRLRDQLNGDGHGLHHRGDDLPDELGALEKGASLPVARDLLDGAAHIDVDGRGGNLAHTTDVLIGLDHPRGLGHEVGLTTEDLHRHGEFLPHDRCQLTRYGSLSHRLFSLLVAERLGGYHLADGKIRSADAADTAKGTVADPCQGRQGKAVRKCNVSESNHRHRCLLCCYNHFKLGFIGEFPRAPRVKGEALH